MKPSVEMKSLWSKSRDSIPLLCFSRISSVMRK
ncbi:unnamed protein product [Strongylus vulgaris]|uniref:Uncharacterized protein n=1 Tax=Strongylus vulgaris TaxID=40348 RepID=A0A3P7LVE7_STRVU|nr:unnamed protein product [Strongylus vulgaris]